ncbi:MAG: DNA replication complex GINS family protein [Nanoarchaeota archaeon]|nr:DNA replication complex GINS family protein [Nanoarchaeota archaeon]
MDKDVVITYETLYEILRREKLRAELQPLDKNFFKDVVKYLSEKQSILDSQMKKVSIFSSSETQKIQKQIENIKRMIQELYERRENKIFQLAVFSSRVNDKANSKGMLDEERDLYDHLVSILNSFRKCVLFNVLSLKNPQVKLESEPKELKTEIKPSNGLVRFLHATPKFIGDDLKVYGPFEAEDVASLPLKVTNILIKNERVEAMYTK